VTYIYKNPKFKYLKIPCVKLLLEKWSPLQMQPGEPSIGDRPYFAARLLGNYLQWGRGFEEGSRDGDITALGCQIDAHKERWGAPCSTEEILVARCFNLGEEKNKHERPQCRLTYPCGKSRATAKYSQANCLFFCKHSHFLV